MMLNSDLYLDSIGVEPLTVADFEEEPAPLKLVLPVPHWAYSQTLLPLSGWARRRRSPQLPPGLLLPPAAPLLLPETPLQSRQFLPTILAITRGRFCQP